MRLLQLKVENFRLFDQLELELAPGLNLFVGDNGAGKTSVLEAAYLLGYGRSFRGGIRDGLIRRGQSRLRVVAELVTGSGASRRLGLERGIKDWDARIDGRHLTGLSELYQELAIVAFEPGSHELISGGSELRRRYCDWGLFHVEPDFLANWRRFHRALRQRNALLKAGASEDGAFEPWEAELADSGERLTLQREIYLAGLEAPLQAFAQELLPELGRLQLRFQRGWAATAGGLRDALQGSRARDRILGHTTVGPHRADWAAEFERLIAANTFSRGQQKLTALICVLAQARAFADVQGHWPVLALDDLASELDRDRLGRVLRALAAVPAQLLLTGTEVPAALSAWSGRECRFHVEQGQVRRLL
jgi:DNA replication and repair protein RecF